MKSEANSISYHQQLSESSKSQNQNSHSCCFYRKESFKTEDLPVLLNQSFKLPSNYYKGTYPLDVQIPDVVPSIDTDILSESLKFTENEITEDTWSLNNSSKNEAGTIKTLHQPILQPVESIVEDNQRLDSNIHQKSGKGSIIAESSHLHNSGSVTNQETYLYPEDPSGCNFNSIPNMNLSSLTVESISNKCLNALSSQYSKCEPNWVDHSNTIISDPDIIVIKDLYPYNCYQSASVSVKPKRLYSPRRKTREGFHMSQDLHLSSHQAGNPEASEVQKSDLMIHHVFHSNLD
ncbi:hypothetical protein HNY73_007458 [Argiope bruennichi]|uniref:Uncharacterized protein n=1 Tax=Argiope bruennichi TaxID=94029 RepID=A0A8T0FEM1_ARGBR|nr:hypothetical protein HNY73_007458 [Argiope bruennichi]